MSQAYESKLQDLLEEKQYLTKEIASARKKRVEASKYAKRLAESNYYLQQVYREVCEQIEELTRRER